MGAGAFLAVLMNLGFAGGGDGVVTYDVSAATGSITLSGVPLEIMKVNLTLNLEGSSRVHVEENTIAVTANGKPPISVQKLNLTTV